jgi:hypothetical protein
MDSALYLLRVTITATKAKGWSYEYWNNSARIIDLDIGRGIANLAV